MVQTNDFKLNYALESNTEFVKNAIPEQRDSESVGLDWGQGTLGNVDTDCGSNGFMLQKMLPLPFWKKYKVPAVVFFQKLFRTFTDFEYVIQSIFKTYPQSLLTYLIKDQSLIIVCLSDNICFIDIFEILKCSESLTQIFPKYMLRDI